IHGRAAVFMLSNISPTVSDPFDMGTAYAYVKGRWIRCISEYYKYFQNRSEKEVNSENQIESWCN
ncbi:hypothetical protein, partial [Nostoc sp. ChiQUE01b]|uniref:hypothetical protein n=1 Tax=Nostoc sp. ChiQUE01b TaxID=3075376 RepID=UPI002AD395D4